MLKHGHWMANILENRDELINVKDELLVAIAKLESIQFYQMVVKKMNKHTTILQLIETKKQLQQELVNAKQIHKLGQANILEEKIVEIEQTLLAIPLYQQYLTAIEDAQAVLDAISEYIQIELSIESEMES